MKALLILTLLTSFSVFATDTTIIAADGDRPSIGFQDSSFSHNPNKTFCYIGSMSEVCAQVQYSVFKMQSQYASGNHDNIELKSCGVKEVGGYYESDRNEIFVEVKYLLTDDYGGNISVIKKITECQQY